MGGKSCNICFLFFFYTVVFYLTFDPLCPVVTLKTVPVHSAYRFTHSTHSNPRAITAVIDWQIRMRLSSRYTRQLPLKDLTHIVKVNMKGKIYM